MSLPPAVFGNFTVDDLVFADGTTRWAVPGGTAAYASLGAALWTGTAVAVAPVGEDYPRSQLPGIDCSRCRTVPHTLRNWGLYEDDGTRHFISRARDRDRLSFCPTTEDVNTGMQTAAHLAAMPLHRVQSLLTRLRQQGAVIVSLDLDDHDLRQGQASIQAYLDLVQQVELYLPSQQDVARLLPGLSPAAALRGLRERSPQTPLIALKMGAAGVLASFAGEAGLIHLPSLAQVVTDTTGAGDAFCGGALAAFAQGRGPLDAVLQGAVSAAFCVEHTGWSGLVHRTPQERDQRMEGARRMLERQ